MKLIAGANIALTSAKLEVRIKQLSAHTTIVDTSAYVLSQTQQKVRGDHDMVFYGQMSTANGSIKLIQQHQQNRFEFDLDKIDAEVGKIALSATVDVPLTMANVGLLQIEVWSNNQLIAEAEIDGSGRAEAALILAEVYRRQDQWKFRLVAQGFEGGLKRLSEHFGVDISEDSPSAVPSAAPPRIATAAVAKVKLSKIVLDKQHNKIDLSKKQHAFGEIKVNLNWQQTVQKQAATLFKKASSSAIDLDLGCFFEMQDGTKSVIQALGTRFGQFDAFPYIALSDDDRTGMSQAGEWLRINGAHWDKIKRVVIFAYIYEGAPNWAATSGVVRIDMPEQPSIEIHLDEGNDRLGMCGIAELVNIKGGLQVVRKMNYVAGHRELDELFGFGLQWKKGRK